MVMRILGLLNAKDTIVGNNSLRGVSGGERRRVTLGEINAYKGLELPSLLIESHTC
ncbi:unnamed protein product [Scytosiphon promiscuus]